MCEDEKSKVVHPEVIYALGRTYGNEVDIDLNVQTKVEDFAYQALRDEYKEKGVLVGVYMRVGYRRVKTETAITEEEVNQAEIGDQTSPDNTGS